MDCNSYSYTAPGFGVDAPRNCAPVDTVTITRKNANGHNYFTISTGESWTTAHDLDTAIKTAKNWMKEGV